MAQEISGDEAAITFASGYTTNAFRWTVSYAAEALETTAFSDTARTFIGGITTWSGSYECWLDDTTVLIAPGAAAAAATFTYSSTGVTGNNVAGSIIITNVEPNVSRDGTARSVTFTFQGTGALTPT